MFEETLARGGAFKGEGRGQEDWRLQRAFGQHRVIAEPHHQRGGAEFLVADLLGICLGFAAHGHGMLLEGCRSSAERRVGNECVRARRSRWSPYHENKQTHLQYIANYTIKNNK